MLGLTRTKKLREVEQERDEEAAFRGSYEAIRDTLIEESAELPTRSERKSITLDENRIAYKKVADEWTNRAVITLLVPAGTKVVLTNKKHRAAKAIVLKIERLKRHRILGGESIDSYHSFHDRSFTYEVGDVVTPEFHPFDDNKNRTCTTGIHCYGKKNMAKRH